MTGIMSDTALYSVLLISFSGLIITWIKTISAFLYSKFIELFVVSLEFNKGDEVYDWLVKWMSEQKLDRNVRSLSVFSYRGTKSWFQKQLSGNKKPQIGYAPAAGSYILTINNRWVLVTKEKNTKSNNNSVFNASSSENTPSEIIRLSMFGRDTSFLRSITKQSVRNSLSAEKDKIVVFVGKMRWGTPMWKKGDAKVKRSWNSVILPSTIKSTLLNDAIEFISMKKWYEVRGLPYRRGYLLYGTPGTGKSSTILALAGKLNLNICCLSLSSNDLTDNALAELLQSTPPKSIILCEDVDAAFPERSNNGSDSKKKKKDENNEQNASKVTFSGLLNALDGVAANEGRILFMTTNHIERLDPALIRPGRVDVKLEFEKASQSQIFEMWKQFYCVQHDQEIKALSILKKKQQLNVASGGALYADLRESFDEDDDELIDSHLICKTFKSSSSTTTAATTTAAKKVTTTTTSTSKNADNCDSDNSNNDSDNDNDNDEDEDEDAEVFELGYTPISSAKYIDLGKEFAAKIGDKKITTAELQGHFLNHKFDPIKAFDTVDDFILLIEETKKKAELAAKEDDENDEKENDENNDNENDDDNKNNKTKKKKNNNDEVVCCTNCCNCNCHTCDNAEEKEDKVDATTATTKATTTTTTTTIISENNTTCSNDDSTITTDTTDTADTTDTTDNSTSTNSTDDADTTSKDHSIVLSKKDKISTKVTAITTTHIDGKAELTTSTDDATKNISKA